MSQSVMPGGAARSGCPRTRAARSTLRSQSYASDFRPSTSMPSSRNRRSPCRCPLSGDAAASSTTSNSPPAGRQSDRGLGDTHVGLQAAQDGGASARRRQGRHDRRAVGEPEPRFHVPRTPLRDSGIDDRMGRTVVVGLFFGHYHRHAKLAGQRHQPPDATDHRRGSIGLELVQEPGLGVDHHKHRVVTFDQAAHQGPPAASVETIRSAEATLDHLWPGQIAVPSSCATSRNTCTSCVRVRTLVKQGRSHSCSSIVAGET